jgi:hypothetical protein
VFFLLKSRVHRRAQSQKKTLINNEKSDPEINKLHR